MHGVQRIIIETGAAVMIVGHTGHADDSRLRGSSHFWGNFDTRLQVQGDKDLKTTKHRFAAMEKPRTLLVRKITTVKSSVPSKRGQSLEREQS